MYPTPLPGRAINYDLLKDTDCPHKDSMVTNIHQLDDVFRKSLPKDLGPLKGRDQGYKLLGQTTTSPGHIPFSPCWFNIANVLSVSHSLRGWPDAPTVQYLRNDQESLCLLGAVFALIHPQLVAIGLSILRGFQKDLICTNTTKNLGPVRLLYPSPATAFSIISNRETHLHQDGKGYSPYYDIIMTLGNYTDGRLEVPGIGLQFKYNPGTIVGICGKALAHGVREVNGD